MAAASPQRLTRRQVILLGITALLVLGMCAFLFLGRQPAPPAGPAPGTYTAGVSRAELGEAWPLTVDEGTLVCYPGRVVTFRAGGEEYAVNGTASGQAPDRGWREIEELSVPTPDQGAGTIKNLGPLLDRGLALCA